MDNCVKLKRKVFEKLPFEVVDGTANQRTRIGMVSSDIVFVGPKRYVLGETYKEHGLDIYNFEARPDDIYLVGFIRSGTTLHCEMVWQIANDLDYAGAEKDFMDYRFPHLDFSLMGIFEKIQDVSKNITSDEGIEILRKYEELTLEGLSKRTGRRFIKCHLPLSLMPPNIFEVGAKVIYCARNPKDMLLSLYGSYEFFKTPDHQFTFKGLFNKIKTDLAWVCPYFEHVKEGWERRNDKNFLFLFYEDTIKDKRLAVQKIADFLEKTLSKDQIDTLEDYLSIEKFKTNKSVNCDQLVKIGLAQSSWQFINKGKRGVWRENLDAETIKEMDMWIEENLKGTDLKFLE